MVTEIGFVSLLVAGFGALAGALVYVAVLVLHRSPGGTRRPEQERRP